MVAASEAPAAGAADITAALCRKSDRLARVLALALLEWILIALLLANGAFAYLISRFAAFFGLAPPCALCCRLGVDSLFEPHHRGRRGRGGGGAEPLRRVLCDTHAAEVSRLGYCRAHGRLADAGDMCEDCAAAAAAPGKALLTWMGRSELGERDLACACCGVALESGFYSPPFFLPTPATRGLGCGGHKGDVVFVSEKGPVIELFDEKPLDASIGVMARCAEIVGNGERLVPLESIDSLADGVAAAVSSQSGGESNEVVDHDAVKQNEVVGRLMEEQIAAVVLAPACLEGTFDAAMNAGETVDSFADEQCPEEDSGLKYNDLRISMGDEISQDEQVEQAALKQESYIVQTDPRNHELVEKLDRSTDVENCQESELSNELHLPVGADVHVAATSYENTVEKQVQQDELNQELESMTICPRLEADEGLEGQRMEQAGMEQDCDSLLIDSGEPICAASYDHTDDERVNEKSSSVASDVLECVQDTFGDKTSPGKEHNEEDQTEAALPSLHQISYESLTSLDKSSPDYSVYEEEQALETPTHIEGICDSQELLDCNETIFDTKSIDSSVATMSTDLEITELVSVDQLKSALAAARKSLNTLHAELENERNAAAISADETMAMINRLQEQKASMQMEAIQYQRLMEEQSEYDQEAMQRLNELVVKREKEKQDLERELELYRHKVHLYEAKVRKISRPKADDQNGSSSTSSSAEDSDDLSQSFYEGDDSGHGLNGSNGSIPTDVVLQETARHLVTLDDSIADFEEERLSILEQLKVLEDRLFDLDDEESDNTKTDKHFSEENHLNGVSNGFSDDDSCFHLHDSRQSVSYRGKKLLPLFDDAIAGAGNILLTKQDDESDHSTEATLELAREQDKLAIASEIDHVHQRLHALEADRDFIKQCVRSLKRGGKGFDLLQEILQHLRDLKRVEQRARNSGELSPHYLHPYTD